MVNNLFVNIPLTPFDFFGYAGGLWILAHIINGLLILSFGITIIWFSHKEKNFLILKLSALSVVLTITAITCGILFLKIYSFPNLYYTENYFSLTMALSFLCVFTVFFSDLYLSKKSSKISN